MFVIFIVPANRMDLINANEACIPYATTLRRKLHLWEAGAVSNTDAKEPNGAPETQLLPKIQKCLIDDESSGKLFSLSLSSKIHEIMGWRSRPKEKFWIGIIDK